MILNIFHNSFKQHQTILSCLLNISLKKFAGFEKNVSCDALKKLTAIFLLALFIFNMVGYRLLMDYAMDKADENFEARLDKGHFDESELITVKVPLNLPYQTNWKEFERVNGEMNVNGTVYKYVQRKVYNDTLILQCIPHHEKTELEKKANDYFGRVNDLPGNDTNKRSEVFKQLTNDYDFYTSAESLSLFNNQTVYNIISDVSLLHLYLPVNGQPPDIS